MQVDAAALSPVTNLTATTKNGDMVFLNSGTLQATARPACWRPAR